MDFQELEQRGIKNIPIDEKVLRKLARLLVGSSVFGRFDAEEIIELGKYLDAFRAEKGAGIFIEGERLGYMCMVISGGLEVVKETSHGVSRKLAEVGPGKTVGEMSMLDGRGHSATVVASQTTILTMLTKRNLIRLMNENPRISSKMLCNIAELLSQRLRQTNLALIDFLE